MMTLHPIGGVAFPVCHDGVSSRELYRIADVVSCTDLRSLVLPRGHACKRPPLQPGGVAVLHLSDAQQRPRDRCRYFYS